MVSIYLFTMKMDCTLINISFRANGKLYRFIRHDKHNLKVEEYKPPWTRVSGYHNPKTIYRDLIEIVEPEQAATIEDYYKQMIGVLADISMQLEALIEANE